MSMIQMKIIQMKIIQRSSILLRMACVLVLSMILQPTLHAQMRHSAFIEPSIKPTTMVGQSTLFAGARFGWVMGGDVNMFVVGASYYAMPTTIPSGLPSAVVGGKSLSPYLHSNYGGLELEYIRRILPDWDVSIGVMLAGAGTTLAIKEDIPDKPAYFSKEWNYWEPHIGVQYALADWCKADVSASYRIVSGIGNHYTITADNLQGFALTIGVRLGRY